jgi:hypothetical protein
MSRNQPVSDEFTNMEIDDMIKYIDQYKEMLKEVKTRRNFVQQERELINSYYEISREEFDKLQLEIEKEEFLMEESERRHKEDINAFINKFKHLEYDHETFITDTLVKNSTKALELELENRAEREQFYMNNKMNLKKDIKENGGFYREDIDKTKMILEKRYKQTKDDLERRLNEIQMKYKNKMIQLEADLELRLKVDIHELEERKNLHINNLIKAFEERMDAWKKENIQQIKDNINLIKLNSDNYKSLKEENEQLEKEVEDLKREIIELEKKYDQAKQEHSQVTNRLAKYYNQDINMENMNAKVNSLRRKCEETLKKTREIENRKEELIKEIRDLKEKFAEAVAQFKARADYKNNLLDEHINQLNENYTKREIEIEEILREVDTVANMDGEGQTGGFGREMILDMLEHIRNVLSAKTQIIKNLKYSLALATKVFYKLII